MSFEGLATKSPVAGFKMLPAAFMVSLASLCESAESGKWTAIWSPSKSALKAVQTSGGIVGTIVAIESDDTVVLRVKPDNVKIQVLRSSVSGLVSGEAKK